MKNVFATSNKYGLPLKAPSSQTILPIICGGNGMLRGFFTIAKTVFTGAETTFALAEGPVAIKSVTLPDTVDDGRGYGVKQYMAAVYDDDELFARPWIGYSAWVDTNDTGYALSYSMPTQGWMTRYNRGVLITNLLVAMDEQSLLPPADLPPVVTPGAVRWVASMDVNGSQLECGFFDFNWVDLFKVTSPGNNPIRLDLVSNPPGGAFKSTLVPYQAIQPTGAVEFNTVRIIKLLNAAAGTYVFNYNVVDDHNVSTPVVLTLTLV